jgi:SpoVK/Ycf46/Vps4 family AAA+-type ATPase
MNDTAKKTADAGETRGGKAQADVTALLKSRHTFLWVTSLEESRVERALVEAAGAATYKVVLWDCEQGLTNPDGTPVEKIQDPAAALAWLGATSGRVALVMRDLHAWVRDPSLLRSLRNAHRRMQGLPRGSARAVIALTPSGEVPPDLRGCATVLDWPLPDRAEVAALLKDTLGALAEGTPAKALAGDAFEAAVDAAVGLSASEAENCYSLSLVTRKAIDAGRIADDKRRIISRIPGLTWAKPEPRGLDAVGGLDLLKSWLRERRSAFGVRARAYGLPSPKGALLVGVPGGGKSLTAKALASYFEVPLIRCDVGAMRSKFVGDSEANVRRMLQTVESLGRCVLWLDEMEKALAGGSGPQGDGGVAADALGTILSWMQDRTCEAFVLATANDVRALPPELLRKGRFDEVWFVDLPTTAEREAVLRAALSERGRDASEIEVREVAEATDGFVGAELAALVPDAMFRAFADNERAVSTADLLHAARQVTPLSKTANKRIEDLRDWAKGRARPASSPETTTSGAAGRALDI